jgi:hypothetical protein
LSASRIETVGGSDVRHNAAKVEKKEIGSNVGFERTRRITGYLVDTLDRFNNAKRAEERDRVKHGFVQAEVLKDGEQYQEGAAGKQEEQEKMGDD